MPERRNGFREFECFAKSGRKKLDRNWGKREGCIGVMLWGLEEQVDLWLSRVLAGRHSRPAAQYAPPHPPDTEKRGGGGALLVHQPYCYNTFLTINGGPICIGILIDLLLPSVLMNLTDNHQMLSGAITIILCPLFDAILSILQ